MSKIEISIEGMTCGHCAMSITNEIATLEGVSSVKVDHTTGKAVVEASEGVTQDSLSEAVAEAGYTATAFANV
jgi:copper ion binding protein